MLHFFLVALGGAIGASARHLVTVGALRLWGPAFPWHTAAINVVGSFLMGVLVAVLARRTNVSPEWRLFLAAGVLGGFTTFSAFALDSWRSGNATPRRPSFYVLGVLGSILAVFAGLALARAFS